MIDRRYATRAGSRMGSGARAALLLTALLVPALTACGGGDDTTSSGSASSDSASQYAYGEAGFEQCLSDSDVQFRKDGAGGLTIVNSTDPSVTKASDRCSSLTTKPQSDALTGYQNDVTLAMADCLSNLGYHVTKNGDTDGLTDGGGNSVASYDVPDSEKQSASYSSDTDKCMKDAEQSIPSHSS